MGKGKWIQFLFFILIILSVISCNKNVVYEKNIALKNNTWNYNDTLFFDVNISDTISAHNIFINVRNSAEYQYSNIYLFLSTYAPNGNMLKDTFDITLADNTGKWYGKGVGSIFSLQVPYKLHIKFPYQGIYTFEIQHAMWNQNLKGISDIGLRISKSTK